MSVTRPAVDATRVVVISNEQPGSRMAGPALRAVHLARELQWAGYEVQLAVPAPPDEDLGVTVRVMGAPTPLAFRKLAREVDVVITQPQRVDVAAGLHRGSARIIYDLYVPSFVEYPASIMADAEPGDRRARKLIQRNHAEYAVAVECGDGFLVASQRQKDFLLGALGQAGRLMTPPGPHDEALPAVAVVPFGLAEEQPPPPNQHRIKGTLVPDDAVVALWAGGVWNWFDPLTVLRGLRAAREIDPRLHLVFLAAGHPSAAFLGQDSAAAALAGAEARELVDSGAVVFADRWVPHRERWDYLSDADFAVCAHFDSPETRMSFRTRFLDHLWAGLPTVTTSGGVLSDRICRAGAGLCVSAGDPEAWAQAMVQLAGDPGLRARMGSQAGELAQKYRWSQVAVPLIALVGELHRGVAPPKRVPAAKQVGAYLAVALENRLR